MLCVLFICVLCEKKYVILYLSLCHSVLQKSPVSLPHSVILSSKNICLTLSLCHYVFKKNICLLPSLCYSVLQKSPVSLRPSVILSSKKHLSHSVPLLFCLQDHPFCLSCPHVTLSSKLPCLPLSLGHYVGHQRIQNLDKTVQKKQKRGCVYYDTPSFVMLLPRRGNQFSASFLFLSSICDVFYSNVHISCNNLCITLEVFSVVPLQVAFKSPYRRQS